MNSPMLVILSYICIHNLDTNYCDSLDSPHFFTYRKSNRQCTILHVSYCDEDPSPDRDFDLARLGQYCTNQDSYVVVVPRNMYILSSL
jgi:hypothetical protein